MGFFLLVCFFVSNWSVVNRIKLPTKYDVVNDVKLFDIITVNCLLADDSYEISYFIFSSKIGKDVVKFVVCCSCNWRSIS